MSTDASAEPSADPTPDRRSGTTSSEAPEAHDDGVLGDTSDLGLRPIAPQIAFLALSSAGIAVTDSLSIAGIAGLFAGSVEQADVNLGGTTIAGLDWIAEPWVVFTFVVLTFVLNAVNTFARERVVSSWEAQRRVDLVTAFRDADIDTQTTMSGSALSVAAEQVSTAANTISGVAGLINTILRASVYLLVSFLADPTVSLLAVACGGVLVVGLRLITRRTRAMHRRMARDRTTIGEQIGEMTDSSRELHLLNRWDDVTASLRRRIDGVRVDRYRSGALATMVGPIYWAGTLFVGLILAAWVRRADSNLNDVAASGLLLIRALGAAQAAQVMYQTYNDSVPYLERTSKIIGRLRGARRVVGTDLAGERPTLEMSGVSISYGNETVVKGLDLSIGGTGGVALVGPSGSGKSTTLLALTGFLTPSEGSITADGVPLQLLPPEELGHTIGFLPQAPRLFRASLRDNALRPDTATSDDEVLATIDRVGLGSTVAGLAEGLDTPMGRGGEGFSGGEMQRFGLVRLHVNQPRVWILDEPTSALDRANSERVTEVINAAMEDHLVILVTHRPELLEHCQRVIFMEDGVVLDDGTLDEVAARQPFVAAMVDSL